MEYFTQTNFRWFFCHLFSPWILKSSKWKQNSGIKVGCVLSSSFLFVCFALFEFGSAYVLTLIFNSVKGSYSRGIYTQHFSVTKARVWLVHAVVDHQQEFSKDVLVKPVRQSYWKKFHGSSMEKLWLLLMQTCFWKLEADLRIMLNLNDFVIEEGK